MFSCHFQLGTWCLTAQLDHIWFHIEMGLTCRFSETWKKNDLFRKYILLWYMILFCVVITWSSSQLARRYGKHFLFWASCDTFYIFSFAGVLTGLTGCLSSFEPHFCFFLIYLHWLQVEGTPYTQGSCRICGEAEGPWYRHDSTSIHSLKIIWRDRAQ